MLPLFQQHVPLAPLTTFRLGGPARFFTTVRDELQLAVALAFAKERDLPFFILGGGSNVLFADEGFDGLVIRLDFRGVSVDGRFLTVAAGEPLSSVIEKAAVFGLTGMEKLAGIPGTVGGAIRGNAGAFGVEMKDLTRAVTAVNTETGERCTFTAEELDFAYRSSFFKTHPEWVIVTAFLALTPDTADYQTRKKSIEETIAERNRRHLQDVQAAGSFFKNPTAPPAVRTQFEKEKGVKSRGGRVPAGWLIEKLGFKGKRCGGALCSEMHPNYLLNTGNATAKEVLQLAREIEAAAHDRFGIDLEKEVQVVALTCKSSSDRVA